MTGDTVGMTEQPHGFTLFSVLDGLLHAPDEELAEIVEHFDFAVVPQLRAEAREKLQRIRPRTLGQAGRISGISTADLAVLLMYL